MGPQRGYQPCVARMIKTHHRPKDLNWTTIPAAHALGFCLLENLVEIAVENWSEKNGAGSLD